MGRIVVIQYLRAAAALGVVAFHAVAATRKEAGLAPLLAADLGQFGVDIFFVVSGFIMWTTVAPGTKPGDFFLRRFIRIAPLYWAATLATALVSTHGGFAFGWSASPGDLLASLFFIPAPSAANPAVIAPILVVGWTLNLEMFFYALFAAALALRKGERLWFLGSLFAALALVGAAIKLAGQPAAPIADAWTQSIVIEFFFGAALGAFWESRRGREAPLAGSLMLVAGLILCAIAAFAAGGLPEWRGFFWGPAALLVVAGALAFEPRASARPSRAGLLLGEGSYALYLTHGMAIALSGALLPAETPVPIALAIKIFGAIAVGVGVHLAFERPAGRFLSRLVTPRPSRRAAAPLAARA